MAQYARGDDRAFDEVYDQVAPRIQSFAARALGERVLAEDIVQQTFLNIHRARAQFVPGSDVFPWAYAIARRLVVDAMRRRKRERALPLTVPSGSDRVAFAPDEDMAGKQTAVCLSLAFAALPPRQRTVLEMRDRGMSLAQMASTLDTTVMAVKQRLYRAFANLRCAVAHQP